MPRITHRRLLWVVAAVVAATVVGMGLLWPGDRPAADPDDDFAQTTELVDATLVEVRELPAADTPGLLPGATTVEVTARLDDTGETVRFESIDETGDSYRSGQRVRLAVMEQEDQPTTYSISDFRRGGPLAVLLVLFLTAVVAFGRLQGLRALLGLALTFVAIIGFIVPAILAGRSPVAVAIVGSLAIMVVTLYLAHGLGRKTTAAVVGTTLALLVTAALAATFVVVASITGFTSQEARLANFAMGGLSLSGLLLAGMIIGCLGVLDDVTMSQSSTVFELHRANPAARFTELFRGALNVGRDHIAATVNTLFLAYAGASLPLLILFVTGADAIAAILTAEIVAVEIVRTLVGSIGLIAAVPLTTALAAAVVVAEPDAARREASHGHGHGYGHGRPAVGRRPPRPAARRPDRPAATAPAAARGHYDDDERWVQRLREAYRLADDTSVGRRKHD